MAKDLSKRHILTWVARARSWGVKIQNASFDADGKTQIWLSIDSFRIINKVNQALSRLANHN